DGAGRCLQLVAEAPQADGAVRATLASRAEDAGDEQPWTTHVCATLRRAPAASASASAVLGEAQAACTEAVDIAGFYAGFEQRGLAFGPDFRSIRRLWRGPGLALGEIGLSAELASQAGAHRIHPVLLDGCLQVLAAALPADEEGLFLPIAVGRFVLH